LEITIVLTGGYCVIGSVVPFHADTLDEAEEGFRAAVRALMRVNQMDSMYKKEVQRTQRIGVGILGIHEFAWKFFKLSFRDIIDETKSMEFWKAITRFHNACVDEAKKYAKVLGVNVPHTIFMEAPNGTIAKLFSLTEGWHLPSMEFYMRWVQFKNEDPLVKTYQKLGYPTRKLVRYDGMTIVGFPTAPVLSTMGLGEKFVSAAQATPEEQFKWLQLGEKYWLLGVDENGNPSTENYGNQISYTLKFDPERVSLKEFKEMVRKYQPSIKCCSVMPQTKLDNTVYEYLPEEKVTQAEFMDVVSRIENGECISEDIGREHIQCSSAGGCPITFNENAK
jgi:hypothetical protein